jgi:hypothetical protein
MAVEDIFSLGRKSEVGRGKRQPEILDEDVKKLK